MDVPHLQLRSEGGRHEPDSLVLLCGAHHRALHRGLLIAEGSASESLIFRHADGSIYGTAADSRVVAAQSQVFAALRKLGSREAEVRRDLDVLRSHAGLDLEDAQSVQRSALKMLTPVLDATYLTAQ